MVSKIRDGTQKHGLRLDIANRAGRRTKLDRPGIFRTAGGAMIAVRFVKRKK